MTFDVNPPFMQNAVPKPVFGAAFGFVFRELAGSGIVSGVRSITQTIRARSPGPDQEPEIRRIHQAVVVQVLGAALVPPGADQKSEVGGVHDAVVVDVADAGNHLAQAEQGSESIDGIAGEGTASGQGHHVADANASDNNQTLPYPAQAYVPIVLTLQNGRESDGSLSFSGMTLTDGGSPILERGFLLSPIITF